jgi:hypothetical protein
MIVAGAAGLLLVGMGAGYFLGTMRDDTDGSGNGQEDYVATPTRPAASDHTPADLVAIRRNAIEDAYPEFRDFESQESFAGQSVRTEVDDGDYYFAYVVHGSGLPIVQATCFRVDRVGRVFEVGVFPDPADSYAGYRDLNVRNCRGIK